MNYEGESFKAVWKDGLLRIRGFKMEDNTLGLLQIILEAAMDEDEFRLAWDLRGMAFPGLRRLWDVIGFAQNMKPKLDRCVTRTSVVVSPKYEKTIKFILRYAGPSCPCYVGTDVYEAKSFVQ